jgi:hypothetical protein
MLFPKITLIMLLNCAVVSAAFAQEHRQHGTHEHGAGQLNIAVEKNQLMLELSLPAMNVVGFEHPASNQTERDQLRRAANLLRKGVQLFSPSPAAKCVQVDVQLESALIVDSKDQHVEEHGDEHGDEHANAHADFDVSYEFNCSQPSQLTALTLSLFEQFAGTQHLRAQVITGMGQSAAELTADNNIVNLK